MKILAVDDDIRVRTMTSEMLSHLGYEVITASNGREALNILKEDKISIVISDIKMPGLDGIELLKEIKKTYLDIEVISITGHSDIYTFTDMIKAGASDFICKPFSKEELEAKIGRVVQENELRQASKKLEEELRGAKDYLDNVVESSLDGIIVGDSVGYIVKVNDSLSNMIDYQKEEIKGRHVMDLSIKEKGIYESTTGETIEIDEEYFDDATKMIYEKLFKEGKIENWESYYLRKDGIIVPVEQNISFLYNAERNVIGSVGVSRDITARKRIEIENAKLLKETNDSLKELKQTQSYLLQREKMASIGQLAAGVAHEINNPVGFVNSNLNSLSKYSNKMLELMNKYEEELSALKSNGSEEMNSFRAGIDELKKKLKMDFVMKDFKKVIADSLEGTGRIKKIVGDLKNFSRADQEEMKPANINEGIDSTINVVWNELKYKCTVEKDYGELPQLYCNQGHLNQVFMNILVNAAHAIETKGVITISTRYLNGQSADNNDKRGHVEVKISDTGSGIPEDKLNRIFEPFFTTKDVGKGTGLGLSIAYDIVQKHKGKITVESVVGKGTTFTIKLPIIEDKEEK